MYWAAEIAFHVSLNVLPFSALHCQAGSDLLCMPGRMPVTYSSCAEEVVDLYLYYAIVGVGMPSTVARAASLRVFGRLVAMDCATQVLKQLPKLKV